MQYPIRLLRQLYSKYKIIFFLIFVIILFSVMHSKINENFITFGDYPKTTELPLLHDNFPTKTKISLSENKSNDLFEMTTIYPSNSKEINNIKELKTPDNGKCLPAELCNAIYDIKPVQQNNEMQPEPHDWNNTRVGYFSPAI